METNEPTLPINSATAGAASPAVHSGSPAPAGRRWLAAVIDRIVSYAITLVIAGPLVTTVGRNFSGFAVGLLVDFVYAGYFYSRHGATLGKMAVGLRVVDASGARLDLVRAGLRDTVGKLISAAPLGAGFIMVLLRQDGRALHDLIFKTEVVRK